MGAEVIMDIFELDDIFALFSVFNLNLLKSFVVLESKEEVRTSTGNNIIKTGIMWKKPITGVD